MIEQSDWAVVDISRLVSIHSNSSLLRLPAALSNAWGTALFMTSSLSTPESRLAILVPIRTSNSQRYMKYKWYREKELTRHNFYNNYILKLLNLEYWRTRDIKPPAFICSHVLSKELKLLLSSYTVFLHYLIQIEHVSLFIWD